MNKFHIGVRFLTALPIALPVLCLALAIPNTQHRRVRQFKGWLSRLGLWLLGVEVNIQ